MSKNLNATNRRDSRTTLWSRDIDAGPIRIGSRVRVFDCRLFKDDVTTPLSTTMQTGVVVRRYEMHTRPDFMTKTGWYYPDLIDVLLDRDVNTEFVSRGHFTDSAKLL